MRPTKSAVSGGLLALAVVSRRAMKLECVDLSQIAHDAAEMLTEHNPLRKVSFNIQEGMTAQCDKGMLRSLITNLLGNAWKFTARADGAEISFFACPGDPENGTGKGTGNGCSTGNGTDTGTMFCVQDNGVGFDMAYADKLFMPFQRLHSVEEFAGTGVGLATVNKIVERHGGTVIAQGEIGKGALMKFTLG